MTARNLHIDLLKGVLTLGMVLAHVIQLLGNARSGHLEAVSQVTNLVSFSGFLYCFGYAAWGAYLAKPQTPWPALLKTAAKCFLAFCASGLVYRAVLGEAPVDLYQLARIAAARDLPPYSGFLLSFAVVTVLAGLFRAPIRAVTGGGVVFAIACGSCALFTLLPPGLKFDPVLGVLIGGQGYSLFPVCLYLPLFLWGVLDARRPAPGPNGLARLAVAGIAILAAGCALALEARRFPPSALWIAGSAGLVHLYAEALRVCRGRLPDGLIRYLSLVGQNVLLYLLVSNAILFTALRLGYGDQSATLTVLGSWVLLMAAIRFLQWICVDPQRARPALSKAA